MLLPGVNPGEEEASAGQTAAAMRPCGEELPRKGTGQAEAVELWRAAGAMAGEMRGKRRPTPFWSSRSAAT